MHNMQNICKNIQKIKNQYAKYAKYTKNMQKYAKNAVYFGSKFCIYMQNMCCGSEARQLWKLSSHVVVLQNVLPPFCGHHVLRLQGTAMIAIAQPEAVLYSRASESLVTVTRRDAEKENRHMSDLPSPASDRAPMADTPGRVDHAPAADSDS